MEKSEVIKELRTKTGLTQEKFAEWIGMPKRTLETWEEGHAIPTDYAMELVKFRVEHQDVAIEPSELNIKELRKMTGLTQIEFAKWLNAKKNTIMTWEKVGKGSCQTPKYIRDLIEFRIVVESENGNNKEDETE